MKKNITVGLCQADTSLSGQNGQNLRIFSENKKNVSLSRQNGNFGYIFNEDVADKTEFSFLFKTHSNIFSIFYEKHLCLVSPHLFLMHII